MFPLLQPGAVAPPRGRGAAMAKPAWMTRGWCCLDWQTLCRVDRGVVFCLVYNFCLVRQPDAPKANAAAIKQVREF